MKQFRVTYNGKLIGYQTGMNAESVWKALCRANPDHDGHKFNVTPVPGDE